MAREFVTAILKALRARDLQTVSIVPFRPFFCHSTPAGKRYVDLPYGFW